MSRLFRIKFECFWLATLQLPKHPYLLLGWWWKQKLVYGGWREMTHSTITDSTNCWGFNDCAQYTHSWVCCLSSTRHGHYFLNNNTPNAMCNRYVLCIHYDINQAPLVYIKRLSWISFFGGVHKRRRKFGREDGSNFIKNCQRIEVKNFRHAGGGVSKYRKNMRTSFIDGPFWWIFEKKFINSCCMQ